MADLIYPDIRIEPYFTRGWVVAGTTSVLYANDMLSGIINTGALNFVVGYRGLDFTFPIQALRSFLDDSGKYLPYPSSLSLKDFPQFVSETDSPFNVSVNLFCSNGTTYAPLASELYVFSSDENVLMVDGISILPVGPGTATITANLQGLTTSLPIIVLATDKKLFAQQDSAGLYPWN